MVERGSRLRFMDEAGLLVFRPQRLGREEFQRNGAAELRILRPVDDPHAALAELFKNLIM